MPGPTTAWPPATRRAGTDRRDWRATIPRSRRPAWVPAVTFGAALALLALAVVAWIAWRPGASPSVVVELPAPALRPPQAVAAGEPAAGPAPRETVVAGAAKQESSGAKSAGEDRVTAGAGSASEAGAGEGISGEGGAGEQVAAEAGGGKAGLDAAIAAERARGGPYEEPAAGAGEGAAEDILDEPFIEVPLAVTGGSNLRSRPTVASARVMWVARGSSALLLDPTPVRGYYRVSIGEREGWIWHLNVEPADLAPADDEQTGGASAAALAPAATPDMHGTAAPER